MKEVLEAPEKPKKQLWRKQQLLSVKTPRLPSSESTITTFLSGTWKPSTAFTVTATGGTSLRVIWLMSAKMHNTKLNSPVFNSAAQGHSQKMVVSVFPYLTVVIKAACCPSVKVSPASSCYLNPSLKTESCSFARTRVWTGRRSQRTKLSELLRLSGERCVLLGMLMKRSFVFVHQVSGA